MKFKPFSVFILILCLAAVFVILAGVGTNRPENDKIVILWSSGDTAVFEKVVYPYTLNSRRMDWWKEAELLIWGPSAKLLAENSDIQEKVAEIRDAGVSLTACKWCADEYSVSEQLSSLGVDVKYMGKPLTEYLKSGIHVLTF